MHETNWRSADEGRDRAHQIEQFDANLLRLGALRVQVIVRVHKVLLERDELEVEVALVGQQILRAERERDAIRENQR